MSEQPLKYKNWKQRTLEDVRAQCYSHIHKGLRQGIQLSPQWLLVALTRLIEHDGKDFMPLKDGKRKGAKKAQALKFDEDTAT